MIDSLLVLLEAATLHISIDARDIITISARKVCHHEEKISLNQRVAVIPDNIDKTSEQSIEDAKCSIHKDMDKDLRIAHNCASMIAFL